MAIGQLLQRASRFLTGVNKVPNSTSKIVNRALMGRKMRRDPDYMRFGRLRMPAPGRMMKGLLPIAALASAPAIANAGTGIMYGGTGTVFSKALAAPGALNRSNSPFANTNIQTSIKTAGALMRQTAGAPSSKNAYMRTIPPGGSSSMSMHMNNRSNMQMSSLGLQGNRL